MFYYKKYHSETPFPKKSPHFIMASLSMLCFTLSGCGSNVEKSENFIESIGGKDFRSGWIICLQDSDKAETPIGTNMLRLKIFLNKEDRTLASFDGFTRHDLDLIDGRFRGFLGTEFVQFDDHSMKAGRSAVLRDNVIFDLDLRTGSMKVQAQAGIMEFQCRASGDEVIVSDSFGYGVVGGRLKGQIGSLDDANEHLENANDDLIDPSDGPVFDRSGNIINVKSGDVIIKHQKELEFDGNGVAIMPK